MRTGSFVAFCTFVILLTFLYLSIPVSLKTGPTGLGTAPIWTGTTNQLTVQTDSTFEINLATLFTSDQPLTYLASRADKIDTRITGSTLTIEPLFGFVGERTITLYASDGETIARKRIKIVVSADAAVEPEQTISPAELKVEPAIEEILARQETVDAIIVLRETTPFTFNANAAKQLKKQILEQRKQVVDQAQDALLAKVNDVPAITGAVVAEETDLEIVREYDTINALAVKLSRSGLAKLRNDPSVAQILLDKPFQAVLTSSVPVIDADDVWNITVNSTNITGKGEGLCILDTGIDLTHTAFTGKIVGGHDYVNEDTTPQDDTSNSHGTHVSGIAAGNSSSVKGVAPDANIIPVKVCNSGNTCAASDILAGIDYCNNNSVILNVTAISGSLSDGGQYTSATCPTLFDSALNTSVALGIIPVFASGNNGYTGGISYPACSPYAISAGSTSDGDSVSGFSNRGGDRLDVFAPGESVTSAAIGGGTSTLSGTSMSTPHVTGAIGLIQHNQRAQNKPILTLAEMRQLLKETGKQVSSWHRIDVYTVIVKLNQNYSINITENSVTNATPPKAKLKFNDATDLSDFVECSELKHNFAHVNSEQCPQYNKSAHIILEGLPGINATPLRNGAACPPEICQNATFNNGTLEFDVTGFTNYSGESYFGTSALVDGCAVINDSSSMTANVSSSGTCFRINASNLYFNCSGFTITYDNGSVDNVAAIDVIGGRSNITIQDCIIRDNNTLGAFQFSINLTGTNNSFILNNTIITNGTTLAAIALQTGATNNTVENNTLDVRGALVDSAGVFILSSTRNIVRNNTITFNGTGAGIWLESQADNNTVANNSINTTGAGNAGIFLTLTIQGTNITGNAIIMNGTGDAGLWVQSTSNYNRLIGNTVRITRGTNAAGIYLLSSSHNFFANNTVTVNGTHSHGVWIDPGSNNNNITGTNITANGTRSFGIFILTSNHTRFTDTLITNATDWVMTNNNTRTNLTNITFLEANGRINIPGLVVLNGSQNVTKQRLNITNNRAFLNSTNLTFLNTSAQITLYNITSIDPKTLIDFEDDGVFTDCPLNICTEISFNTSGDNTYVFNVTQFTTYSSNDATVFSCNVTINTSAVLTQDITANGTCITFGSDNITLDCNGRTLSYGAQGDGNGIIASGRTNITVQECIIRAINSSGTFGHAINLTRTNDSRIVNNSLFTNGSNNNHGIVLQSASNRNRIENNTIDAQAITGNQSFGIRIIDSNNTVLVTTMLSNLTDWINLTGNISTNLTNTTFLNANGSIRFSGSLQINNSQEITRSHIAIRTNRAFLNSTNLTTMNTSARITLFSVSFTNPQPEVDFEDDSTFVPCPASICNEISYSGTTYVFDVTQFSAHQGGETQGGGGSVGGAGGGAGGGGGGGDKKKDKQETPTQTEQPTQDLSKFLNEQPTEQPLAPTETIQEQQEVLEPEPIASPEARQQRVTKSIATIFYLVSFVSLAVLVVLWAVWHRRK